MTDGITIEAQGLDELERRMRTLTLDMGRKVEGDALKELGGEALRVARSLGPRSARHRGPGKTRREKWRSPTVHAIDTIKVSAVRTDKSGRRYITVGPQKGDNSPTFYLKFLEYGWVSSPRAPAGSRRAGRAVSARPFLRPAQAAVSTQERIIRALNEAMDRRGV